MAAADLANAEEERQPRRNLATAELMHVDIEAQLHGVVASLRTSMRTHGATTTCRMSERHEASESVFPT